MSELSTSWINSITYCYQKRIWITTSEEEGTDMIKKRNYGKFEEKASLQYFQDICTAYNTLALDVYKEKCTFNN
jgi:hypothetical protein